MSTDTILNLLLAFIGLLLFVLGVLVGFMAAYEDWFGLKAKKEKR